MTTPTTAPSPLSLEVTIEPGAKVASTATISLAIAPPSNNNLTPSSPAAAGPPKSSLAASAAAASKSQPPQAEDNAVLRLVISSGNVFHPSSNLEVVPSAGTRVVRIGPDNLFEEGCIVVLDMGLSGAGVEPTGIDGTEVMGHNNHFAPLSSVRAGSVGSANTFEPSCRVDVPSVGGGNVVGPLVKLDWLKNDSDPASQQQICPPMDETVYYSVQDGSWGDDATRKQPLAVVRARDHVNGVGRNTKDMVPLLRAAGKVLAEHHELRS